MQALLTKGDLRRYCSCRMCALCEILIVFMYWYQNEQHGRGIDQSYLLDQLGPEHGGGGGGGGGFQCRKKLISE